MEKKTFTHLSEQATPQMVDVGHKKISRRTAIAETEMQLGKEIMDLLQHGEIQSKKGAVFQTAIIAGTMAVKQTSNLIPFCHPLQIEDCKITVSTCSSDSIKIVCQVSLSGKTGVEMEALTGASLTALTIYDMCKSISSDIVIKQTKLLKKTK